MKRYRLSLLALFVLVGSSAMWAHDFEVDGIYYNITSSEDKTVEVTFRGEYYDSYSHEYTGAVTIPETITYGEITYHITSIGDLAFHSCSNLITITIPKSVTSIGEFTFSGCSGLTSMTIPNGVKSIKMCAFAYCSGLTSITIPNSVTSIEDAAFGNCSGLTSITIPNSVTSIGNAVFLGCNGLTSIVVEEGNEYYDSRNNCNAIIKKETNTLITGCKNTSIPNSITSIGMSAFMDCSGLTSITIPEGVTSIGYEAFKGCSGLTSITIPSNVTSIGTLAFMDCSGLTSITISEGVTSIGSSAFTGCSSLTSITIPNSATMNIESPSFQGCSSLTSVIIGNGVTSIGRYAFQHCKSLTSITIGDNVTSIEEWAFDDCTGLTSVIIGNSVTSIGKQAFGGCSGLTSITIPNSVTSIGDGAFRYCSGLTSITISEGVTSIGDGAFQYCSGLTSITIPKSVTSIGTSAFYNCDSLTSITISDGVTNIGNGAFKGCSGLTSITIPSSVTSVGDAAFAYCYGLNSLTISEGVTSIGSEAFFYCFGLTSITIPKSVMSIGQRAFCTGENLLSVNMLSSTPPTTAEYAIPYGVLIYVPYGASGNYYDVAPWYNFEIKEKGEDYAIWASDMRTRPTKPITLSVQLNNVNAISDYQFDLALPKGFSIAMDEDDLEMIYLSTERTTERKHTYSYNMLSDSLLRVICYSNSTYTFSGTEGEVLTITLDVAADVADGDYNLMIKNIEMTEPDGTAHKASDYPCKVTVISYTPGDVNDDGNFSVTDVRGVVNMVLAAQVPDDNPAADVNEDGVISVTDVRGAVNLVLNPVAPTALLSSKMRAATSTANMLYIDPFSIAPGEEKEVLVMLNNPDNAFSDIQFDLYLPEGIEVVNDNEGYLIGLGSRTDLRNHNRPEAALQRDGSVRVLCYSDKAETFFGHSGDVMRLTLKASDTLSPGIYSLGLKNVELARPNMTNDRLQASTASVSVNGYATGIGSLEAEMERGEVYDLNGRRVQQPAKGVYVINGKKIIIK